jgi:ABC-type transport system involved in cytochrome bd biosynthesis fused ATPase/permease subunit
VARATGQTVIVACHEAPPAHLVDRAVTMDGGRLAAPPLRTPAAKGAAHARAAAPS